VIAYSCSLFVVRCSLVVVRCSLFVVRCAAGSLTPRRIQPSATRDGCAAGGVRAHLAIAARSGRARYWPPASAIRPPPAHSPITVTNHSVAAVVTPIMRPSLRRFAPAPVKPTPVRMRRAGALNLALRTNYPDCRSAAAKRSPEPLRYARQGKPAGSCANLQPCTIRRDSGRSRC
jgi:hypothetical protein